MSCQNQLVSKQCHQGGDQWKRRSIQSNLGSIQKQQRSTQWNLMSIQCHLRNVRRYLGSNQSHYGSCFFVYYLKPNVINYTFYTLPTCNLGKNYQRSRRGGKKNSAWQRRDGCRDGLPGFAFVGWMYLYYCHSIN